MLRFFICVVGLRPSFLPKLLFKKWSLVFSSESELMIIGCGLSELKFCAFSENTSTVRPESSSDEEETRGVEDNDSMDVDQNPDRKLLLHLNFLFPSSI